MSFQPAPVLSHRLLTNSAWNVLAGSIPMLAAVLFVPGLIDALGAERFGILALGYVAIGYFSLFDLGLGRALTQLIAERRNGPREAEVPAVASTAVALMSMLGLGAACLLALLTPVLVTRLFNIAGSAHNEALLAFWILAATLPIVILSSAYAGILEACQRFRLLAGIRIPMGAATFLAPWLAVKVSPNLGYATAAIAIARVCALIAYARAARAEMRSFGHAEQTNHHYISGLLRYGGWLTVSNVVSPIMVYFDRFMIAAWLTMSAVTYYSAPYDVVSRLTFLPVAIMGATFPAITSALSNAANRVSSVYYAAARLIFIVAFPVCAFVVLLAREGLNLWLGADFSTQSTLLSQILAVGLFMNSAARVPHATIQASGSPHVTAKIHLLEAPFYILLLWFLIGRWGIHGAAIAWTVRMAIDLIAQATFCVRCVPILKRAVLNTVMLALAGTLALLALLVLNAIAIKVSAAILIIFTAGFLLLREFRLQERVA
jgi:O-antigen/teichoic acid export membrane protein